MAIGYFVTITYVELHKIYKSKSKFFRIAFSFLMHIVFCFIIFSFFIRYSSKVTLHCLLALFSLVTTDIDLGAHYQLDINNYIITVIVKYAVQQI